MIIRQSYAFNRIFFGIRHMLYSGILNDKNTVLRKGEGVHFWVKQSFRALQHMKNQEVGR